LLPGTHATQILLCLVLMKKLGRFVSKDTFYPSLIFVHSSGAITEVGIFLTQ
jgi:hypothetical protein